MLAHLYLRFSHGDQAYGTSIARQRKLTRKLCAERGWDVAEDEWIDEAKSASKGRNRAPGGALHDFEVEALAGLHHGTVLVCEMLDRISRQGFDATRDFIAALGKAGVSVATTDGAFYEAGKPIPLHDVMVMLIKAETAREEAAKRAMRTRERHALKRAEAAATGAAMGKLAPFWLTIEDGHYAPIPERAALVLRMFQMADAESAGALTIAKTLNAEGVPVWQRWEKRPVRAWDRKRVARILADDAVVGWRRGKGDPIRIYPQIVPSDLFERVRANAPVREETKGGGKSAVVANLVSGLATCDRCGSKMEYQLHRREGRQYRTRPAGNLAILKHASATLLCSAAAQRGCLNRAGITYYGFERALLDAALHIALGDTAFVQPDELGRLSRELADKRHSLEHTRARAERLWEAWADEDQPSEMSRRLAQKAEGETKALEAEIATLAAARQVAAGRASAEEHLGRIEAIRSHLYDADLEVRRVHRKKVMEGLRSVISHIWCDERKVATVVFAGGMAALQIQGGKVVNQANAVRMFDDRNFRSLRVPQRMARTVHERVSKALIANGCLSPKERQSSMISVGRDGAAVA